MLLPQKTIPIQKIMIILCNKKLVKIIQEQIEKIIMYQFPYPKEITKRNFAVDISQHILINLINHTKDAVIAVIVLSSLFTCVKTIIPQKDYFMTGILIYSLFMAYQEAT